MAMNDLPAHNIYAPIDKQNQAEDTAGDENTLCGNTHDDAEDDQTCILCQIIKRNL